MELDDRNKLWDRYRETHAAHVSKATYKKTNALWPHFKLNYGPLLKLDRSLPMVEIGPGNGSLMSWLKHNGFTDVTGVEIASDEALRGQMHDLRIVHSDGIEYLRSLPSASLGGILLKAVLEHVPREKIFPMLEEIRRTLRPDGLALIEVPNMDWIVAGHERYMDFTHEVGFTRESLAQVLRISGFNDIVINGSRRPIVKWYDPPLAILRPFVVAAIRLALYAIGEGAGSVLFECRSIIAFARVR